MSRKNTPVLYIKRGCPWCRDAMGFFADNGVEVEVKDVNVDRQAMARMVELSGQSLTPTFEYGEFLVADFDVDELVTELDQNPEVKKELGFPEELS